MYSTILAGAKFFCSLLGGWKACYVPGLKIGDDADRLGSYQKILGQGHDVSDEARPEMPLMKLGRVGTFWVVDTPCVTTKMRSMNPS